LSTLAELAPRELATRSRLQMRNKVKTALVCLTDGKATSNGLDACGCGMLPREPPPRVGAAHERLQLAHEVELPAKGAASRPAPCSSLHAQNCCVAHRSEAARNHTTHGSLDRCGCCVQHG
jgi:hypothetical protein